MDDKDPIYKDKRKRNNESVKKCRENEKQKIEETRVKSKKLKQENEALEEKLTSLKKEVDVLKSLFEKSSNDSLSSIVSLNNGAAAFLSLATSSNSAAESAPQSLKDKASTGEDSATEPNTPGTRGRKKKKAE